MKAKNLKNKVHKKRGVVDLTPVLVEASISQLLYADSLLITAILNEKEKEQIDLKLKGFVSNGECEEIITYLKQNQIDPIASGFGYNMKDIQWKLKQTQ